MKTPRPAPHCTRPIAPAIALATLGIAASTAVHAQASPQTGTTSLEAVTITAVRERAKATRQDVELRDLPQSVTLIPAQTAEDRSYTRIEDLSYATVNLQANNPYTGGVSIGFFSRGFNGTGVLVDGYNAGIVSGFTSNIYELASFDRFEVLRGPASVLYGQGNPGGVLNLSLKRPQQATAFESDLLLEDSGTRRGSVDWNQPLGQTVGLRLVGALEDSGTFRDFGERRVTYLSPALRWQPASGMTIDALYAWGDYRFNNDRGFSFQRELIRDLPVERNLSEPWLPLNRYDVRSTRLELTQAIGAHWSVSVGAFETRQRTRDGQEIGPSAVQPGTTIVERYYIDYPNDDRNRARDRTLSARLQGRASDPLGLKHRLIIGVDRVRAFYLYEAFSGSVPDIDYGAPVYGSGPLTPATTFEYAGGGASNTQAIYVNDLIELGHHWKLQLGLRHDSIETLGYTDAVFTVGDRQKERRLTPSAGLVWQPSGTRSYYASYATSFLPQFGRNRLGDILAPEQGKSFEIGLKHELLDRRIALTAALFQIDKSDILQTDPLDPCCNINGGSARSRGGELELAGRPWRGAQIQLGVGVADARWTESNTFPVGARLPGASPVTAVASIKQHSSPNFLGWLPPGSWVAGTVSYGSSREWTPATDSYKLPAYVRIDLGARIAVGRNVDVQLNIKNLLDERITLANGFGLVAPDAARTFGVTLRWTSGHGA